MEQGYNIYSPQKTSQKEKSPNKGQFWYAPLTFIGHRGYHTSE